MTASTLLSWTDIAWGELPFGRELILSLCLVAYPTIDWSSQPASEQAIDSLIRSSIRSSYEKGHERPKASSTLSTSLAARTNSRSGPVWRYRTLTS